MQRAARHSGDKDIRALEIREKYAVRKLLVAFGGWAAIVACSALPFAVLASELKELAGKETRLTVNVTLGLTIAGIAAVVTAVAKWRKASVQAKELERLRARCTELEQTIIALEQKQKDAQQSAAQGRASRSTKR